MARVLMGPFERALVLENPHPSLDDLLRDSGIDVVRVEGGAPDEDDLIALLQEHRSHVVFKRSRVQITRRVVESCPDLFAVQLCCIGDDSVDKVACADHGVLVFNDPVSNGRSVVELAVAHLLALSRRLYETDPTCRAGVWEKNNIERYEVRGKVLGVLGLGNIGRATARAAEQLGMRVRFFDSRAAAAEVGVEFGWDQAASLGELFRGADYVTAHLSARDARGRSNEGLLSKDVLMQLGADRPESSPRIFLNLSRGFLHTADDLLETIQAGRIRRAAVDVYPSEPRGGEVWINPYVNEPRVAVTPHIGASTQEAQPRIARRVTLTLGAFSRYGAVRDCVYAPRTRLGPTEPPATGQVVLVVTHAHTRGTKRAVDDAIFQAGASNLSSTHRDFPELGFAVDLAVLDGTLTEEDVARLVHQTAEVTGDPSAIRSVRQLVC